MGEDHTIEARNLPIEMPMGRFPLNKIYTQVDTVWHAQTRGHFLHAHALSATATCASLKKADAYLRHPFFCLLINIG